MSQLNVERRETHTYGLGVFALEDILAGTLIAEFDGNFASAEKASLLPTSNTGFDGRHAIQCGPNLWRDGKVDSIARYLAHSCNPNCGIVGYFKIVTMRNIKAGEELTWDYAMTEASDARIECLCGAPNCRGIIGSFLYLEHDQLIDFVIRCRGYISHWLLDRYPLLPLKMNNLGHRAGCESWRYR